jgi:hypothetical protein
MTKPVTSATPAHWNDAEVLDGLAIVAKTELIDQPFRITGVQFETGKSNDISYVYVDGEFTNGETFTFNDSSSGVRAQVVEYLKARGRDAVVDTGAYEPLNVIIPRGLRYSEYDVNVADERGRFISKTARTYYLTTSGKRVNPNDPTRETGNKTLRGTVAKAAKATAR